jgi:oligopeptide transport system substrate-binding protein
MGRAASVFVVAACLVASVSSKSWAQDGRVLRRGGAGEPETFDPHKFLSAFEGTILTDLFAGLTVNSADDRPIPGAAESWEISPDGLTLTFDLRDGMFWSDGTPQRASDFVYSFRRILDPATASSVGSLLKPIVNAAAVNNGSLAKERLGVEAPDDDTLIIRLNYPAPYLLEVLSFIGLPVAPHAIEEHGDAWIRPENIVVNGPYILDEWVVGSHVKLVKNETFHAAEDVYFDAVYHVPSEDMRAGFARFRAGELDTLVFFPPDQLQVIEQEMPDALRTSETMSLESYVFNTRRRPFDDARVRRALSMAIDRETLTDRILRTGEVPAYGYSPTAIRGYANRPQADFKEQTLEDRIERAKALLAEAGFGPAHPLRVELKYNTQDTQARIAAAIAAMWRRIGVETDMINLERRVLASERIQGNYQVARFLRVGATYDPVFTMLNLHSTLGDYNVTQFNDSEYDRLFEQAWFSADQDVRVDYLRRAEARALDLHPLIALYYQTARRLVRPDIRGWEDNARGIYPSRWLSRAD